MDTPLRGERTRAEPACSNRGGCRGGGSLPRGRRRWSGATRVSSPPA